VCFAAAAGNSVCFAAAGRYGRPMHTTHALLATAMTPARGSLHSIRLRDRRPVLVA
jgi:hypothetical protein